MRNSFIALLLFIGAALPVGALGSGELDIHLTGVLPTDPFAQFNVSYRTCKYASGNISARQDQNWRPIAGPVRLNWGDTSSCAVQVQMTSKQNGVHYMGSATCEALDGAIVDCAVPVCRRVNNGPLECQ